MFNRFIKIVLSFLFTVSLYAPVCASEIPQHIGNSLKKSFPKLTVRFDGLIELGDGTQYLPVYPMVKKECANPSDIQLTIPKNMKLQSKPDMVMFNDNFTIFKIIRKSGEKPTLISSNDIPIQVKMGLFPQDLLVPENLVIPTELRILLGDLVIPVREDNDFKNLAVKSNSNDKDSPQKISLFVKSLKNNADFKNANFYVVNNSNKIAILNPLVGRPDRELVLDSIPADLKMTRDKRYILISALSKNKVCIMDSTTNAIIKELPVGKLPSSIAIADRMKRAYVANKGSSSISVINLKDMAVTKDLNVTGIPKILSLSFDHESLFYVDAITGNVYQVTFRNTEDGEVYDVNYITRANNVSQIALSQDHLFILSRTDNALYVYDFATKTTKKIEVGQKPVDIQLVQDKYVYVLNAGSDSLSVLSMPDFSLVKTIELSSGKFPTKIQLLKLSNKALVTFTNSNQMIVIDTEKNEIENRIPISIPVGSLVILNK